jgi:hypothetical protein
MKKILLGLVAIILLTGQASAHSGSTDKNGGHNCSQASIDKGLCSGYHYHSSKASANNTKVNKEHQEHTNAHKHENKSKPIVNTKS